MERTTDFVSTVEDIALHSPDSDVKKVRQTFSLKGNHATNPFLIQALDLVGVHPLKDYQLSMTFFSLMQLSQLIAFEDLVNSVHDHYVDYHRYMVGCKSVSRFSEMQRNNLKQEITVFITTFGGAVSNLSKSDIAFRTAAVHHAEIISYLVERLNQFTKLTQSMQLKYQRESLDPFKLFSTVSGHPVKYASNANFADNKSIETVNKMLLTNKIKADQATAKSAPSSSSSLSSSTRLTANTDTIANTIPSDFSSRYEDEIASTTKVKEYKAMGAKHREILMKEATSLQTRFHEDLVEAHRVESTVRGISAMLGEFTNILRGQTGLVGELYDTATEATDFVSQADNELQLTIQRTTSHSRNMTLLAVGLALFLLLLDWITP